MPVTVVVDDSHASASTPIGYQQITNEMLVAVVGLSPPEGALRAVIQSNGVQPVRWRDDGPPPGKMRGMRLNGEGDELVYAGDLHAILFIAETDGAVLDVAYYG